MISQSGSLHQAVKLHGNSGSREGPDLEGMVKHRASR